MTASIRNRKSIRLVLVALVLFLLIGLGARLVPLLFNINSYKGIIERYIERESGFKVNVTQIDVSFRNGFGFNLLNVEMTDPVTHEKAFQADRLLFLIDPLSLLTSTLKIQQVKIVHPFFSLVRGADGRFQTQKMAIPIPGRETRLEQDPKKEGGLFFEIETVEISNAALDFIDFASGENPAPLHVERLDANLTRDPEKNVLVLSALGRIPTGSKTSTVEIFSTFPEFSGKQDLPKIPVTAKISVSSFPLRLLQNYLPGAVPFQIEDSITDFQVNLEGNFPDAIRSEGSVTLHQLTWNKEEWPIRSGQPFDLWFRFRFNNWAQIFRVTEFDLKNPMVDLAGEATVKEFRKDDPELSLRLTSGMIPRKNLEKFFSPSFLSSPPVQGVQKIVGAGSFALQDFSFSGRIGDLSRPSLPGLLDRLGGTLEIENASFAVPALQKVGDLLFEEAKVVLKNGVLTAGSSTGLMGPFRLTEFSGTLENLGNNPKFEVHVSGNLDAEEGVKMVRSGAPSESVGPYLESVDNIRGEAQVVASAKGTTADLVHPELSGSINFKDVGFTHPGIPFPVHNVNGFIRISDRGIDMNNLHLMIGKSSFRVNGALDLWRNASHPIRVAVDSSLDLSDYQKSSWPGLDRNRENSGSADLFLEVEGSTKSFSTKGHLDLTEADFSHFPSMTKPKGLFHRYEWAADVQNSKDVSLKEFRIQTGGSDLKVSGQIKGIPNKGPFHLVLRSDQLRSDDLLALFDFMYKVEPGALARGELTLDGNLGNWEKTTMNGKMSVGQLGLVLDRFPNPIRFGSGEFKILTDQLFFVGEKASVGKTHGRIEGNMKGWADATLNIIIQASELNFRDFFKDVSDPNLGKNQPDTTRPVLTWEPDMNLVIFSDKGIFEPIEYRNLQANLNYSNDFYDVPKAKFQAYQGNWSFIGSITDVGDYITRVHGILVVDKMEMSDYLTIYGKDYRVISGKTDVLLDFDSTGRGWDTLKRRMDGDIKVHVDHGVLKSLNILSKIFGLISVNRILHLELPDLTTGGMPFHYISGDFKIKEGVGHTENFLIESDSMRLTAVGNVDIHDETVKLMVGMQPFQTVDSVVSKIPVAGKILTGKDKSLVAAYYTLEGPVADPKVTPIPAESLGRVGGIFKRLFSLPRDVILGTEQGVEKKKKEDQKKEEQNKEEPTPQEK